MTDLESQELAALAAGWISGHLCRLTEEGWVLDRIERSRTSMSADLVLSHPSPWGSRLPVSVEIQIRATYPGVGTP